jgi:hypothetical protein
MKNLVSGFIFIITIAFALGSCEVPTDSGTTTVIPKIYDNTVEKPVASPSAGTVAVGESVALSTTTEGVAIWYTIDGGKPAKDTATQYVDGNPISIDDDTTVRAVAVKEGWNDSAELSAAYIVDASLPQAPSFNVAAGTYDTAQSVTIADIAEGGTAYYTLDGSNPFDSNTKTEYESTAVAIDVSGTLKAVVVKGGKTSAVREAAYTLKVKAPTPSTAAGAVNEDTEITLSTATTGATVYYTVNGSAPTSSTATHGTEGEATATVTISAATTVKAIAVKTGWTDSEVLTAAYTIKSNDNSLEQGQKAIATLAEFKKIGKDNDYPLDGNYKQTADIMIGTSDNWTPIGITEYDQGGTASYDKNFKGTFDGGDYNIIINDDLTFDSAFSFFGDTDGATLKNIHITGTGSITVTEDYANLGGIATIAINSTITNCSNAVALTAYGVGGICSGVGYEGDDATSVIGCKNTGAITGECAGGIAGFLYDGVIQKCSNSGAITGTIIDYGWLVIGGICGNIDGGDIIACYNTGIVSVGAETVSAAIVGGIVGADQGTDSVIIACYNTGAVAVTASMDSQMESDSGNQIKVGGFVGELNYGNNGITACYNIGKVSQSGGGIVGYYIETDNNGTIKSCYWQKNADSSAATNAIGAYNEENTGTNDSNISFAEFSGGAWPNVTENAAWGIGTGSENGYWKNLGGWNSGTPTYPKLWWE